MTKVCTQCGVEKDLGLFHRDPKGKFGRRAFCGVCASKKMKLYYQRNTEKVIESAKKTHIRRMGLTKSEFDSLLERQGGKCAICRSFPSQRNPLCIDHDHSCCSDKGKCCGKCIRGLLCRRCNNGLGQFKDDKTLLLKAIDYLEQKCPVAYLL